MTATWQKPGVLRGLLLLAVCLNACLAAYIGMQSWGKTRFLLATTAPPVLISRVAERLPEADAQILRQAYERRKSEMALAQKDARQALLSAAALLGQAHVDETGLRLAVKEARDRRLAVGDLTIEVFLDAFPKMSEEGRKGLLMKSLP